MASIEIETLEALEVHLADGLPMGNVVVQGLDLSGLAASLDSLNLAGTVFLGTQLAQSTYERACADGAVIFRPPLETPFSRPTLTALARAAEDRILADAAELPDAERQRLLADNGSRA